MSRLRLPPWVPLALALLMTGYGALLRLDAFVQKHGPLDRPAWARVATTRVAALAVHVRPSGFVWRREPRSYVGGDPINYIRFAREMESFYQPSVREPMFLALTRLGLWLLADQDAGISLASAVGSVLTIAGVYLLGAALASPAAGLGAALIVAIEYEIITWAVDGWRDDTFMALVVFTAWAAVRVRQRPTFARAVILGVLAGLVCLTRITALSCVVPALAWLVLDGPSACRRVRIRMTAVALLILVALVGPYLLSCALATGDPFLAANYHTRYYRFGEGLPSDQPMSAAEYIRLKVTRLPVGALDTAFNGIVVQPFVTKWRGLDGSLSGLGATVSAFALAGLLLMPFFPDGRLLLLILASSLVPYCLTWNIAGGGEWRFTMHAYPIFVVAAFVAVERAVGWAGAVWHRPDLLKQRPPAPALRRVAAVIAMVSLGVGLYRVLPWFVVRELVASQSDVSIQTGSRDRVFFGAGWSPPHQDGPLVTVRVSNAERAVVRIPLSSRRAYDIVLRLDPVDAERQNRVTVLWNRQLLGALHLGWNPERVGSYRLKLPAHVVRRGSNELTLVPHTLVDAGSAGPRFAWLDHRERLGIRLWYVRVLGS